MTFIVLDHFFHREKPLLMGIFETFIRKITKNKNLVIFLICSNFGGKSYQISIIGKRWYIFDKINRDIRKLI